MFHFSLLSKSQEDRVNLYHSVSRWQFSDMSVSQEIIRRLFLFLFAGYVEASVRLPGHVGGSDWWQLQGCDPRASHGPGQDEEPHHQTLEAPDRHTHPGQLLGCPAELRLQPVCSGRLRHLNPSIATHQHTLLFRSKFFFSFLKLHRLKCCISAVCSLWMPLLLSYVVDCSCSVAFSSSCPGQHHQTGPMSPANNTVLYGARSIHRDSFNSFSLAQLCIFVLLLWHSSFLSNHLVKICGLNAKKDIFIKKRHF